MQALLRNNFASVRDIEGTIGIKVKIAFWHFNKYSYEKRRNYYGTYQMSRLWKGIFRSSTGVPNCGRPNQAQGGNVQPNENGIPTPYNQGYRPTVTVSQSQPIKKNSGLSIAALIFSIMGCTFIVGIILSIIDLCKKDDTRKHTLSKVALVISCIWLIIGIVGSTGNDNDKTSDVAIATSLLSRMSLKQHR